MKGAVSTGHALTTWAASEILKRGGNAFDAAVAAGFASAAAEPTLTGLGGGGFLLAHLHEQKEDILYDFFVDAPGREKTSSAPPTMVPVEVDFSSHSQTFYIGMTSVAVPGVLKGLIEIYNDLCSMDISTLVEPALEILNKGVRPNNNQKYQMKLLAPVLSYTEEGREVFTLKDGRLYNHRLKNFLSLKSPERWLEVFYHEAPLKLQQQTKGHECLLGIQDMALYRVFKRRPLSQPFREFVIVTNPPPSTGGRLILQALQYIQKRRPVTFKDRVLLRVEAMQRMNLHLQEATRGTTHISIIDQWGNAASMTISNGTGSGCFMPDTGIMLNNMMGEEDLHREGFFTIPAGHRIPSMMSPTFIKQDNRLLFVLGTGGSMRIRTALLQVILNLIDEKMDISQAIEAPRFHLDDNNVLQIEPGFDDIILDVLSRNLELNIWSSKDMYFGGVNAVTGNYRGHADSRREGVFSSIK